MIDLHSHTLYSDGSDRVEEILKNAQEVRLKYLSITDHNTVDAYYDKAIGEKAKWFDGTIIPGVEITTTYHGEIVEVLGYGFDLDSMKQELENHVLTFENKQRKEYALIADAYTKAGITFDAEAIQFDPQVSSCRKSFWKEIIKYPENVSLLSNKTSIESSSKFTRQEVYNPQSKYYVDQTSLYPSFQETIDIIHRSGGIAFLAHLYIYSHANEFREDLKNMVEQFKLDGIECYYSTFNQDQMNDLDNFCTKNKFLKSGGSDYHGSRKPDIQLGIGKGELRVPDTVLMNWLDYIVKTKF